MEKRDAIVGLVVVLFSLMIANSVFNFVTYTGLRTQQDHTRTLAQTNATTEKQVAALTKVRRGANLAKLAAIEQTQLDAATAQCLQGNHHRSVTNEDAADTYDVLSLLVVAIAHPSSPQTAAQQKLGSAYLTRLRNDLSGLERLPQINCTLAVEHPLSYTAPLPIPFVRAK